MMNWLQTRISQELGPEYGAQLWMDAQENIRLYAYYQGVGQAWNTPQGLDYRPNKTTVNHTKRLIDKVSGFMFSRAPEITLQPMGGGEDNARRVRELERHVRQVLEQNGWQKRLLQAGRDCFVGKRVALKVGVHGGRLVIRFRPSMEFFHDVSVDDVEKLDRIIFAYGLNDKKEAEVQRIWVQSWRMQDGRCLLTEGVYNGFGTAVREDFHDAETGLDAPPAYVILNEGMTSDVLGDSDVARLIALQDDYNRMVSDDQDALRFHMFPQTVFTDASESCLGSIKISPGAIIDLQTDPSQQGRQAKVAKLETHFSYDERFQNSLDALLDNMYTLMSCPRVTPDYLKAAGASGKALRAMYWDLQCRCEERWAEWDPALVWLVREIVRQEKVYGLGDWTDCHFAVRIEHLYPLSQDEEEERRLDLEEVAQRVRSRRSYLDKWQPGADADRELAQMETEASGEAGGHGGGAGAFPGERAL